MDILANLGLLIIDKLSSFVFWNNIFFIALIFISLATWITFRKKTKILADLVSEQKILYKSVVVEKSILEEELLNRSKQLHDLETLLEVKVDGRVKQLKSELALAKEIAKTKDEFLRITSHELRTPMDVLRGNIDMILKGESGKISEKTREYLEDALLGSDRLVRIVNDMLDISRIETGTLKFHFKEFDVKEIIQMVVKEFEPIIKKKKLKLLFTDVGKLSKVFADPEKVIQILDNLIGNALKFTSNGAIEIYLSGPADAALIEIKDSGMGISKEDQQKLFQKFPQIDASIVQTEKGTGLGLYICRELINKMGGEIWVESEGIDKGALFKLTIPFVSSQKAREIQRLYELQEKKIEFLNKNF